MVLSAANYELVSESSVPPVQEQTGSDEPVGGSIAVHSLGPALLQPRSLIFVAIWFIGGLVLGGLVALLLMPGLLTALVSIPVQNPITSASPNQTSQPSLPPSLYGQPFLIFSLLLSIVPLLATFGLIAATRLRLPGRVEAEAAPGQEAKQEAKQEAAQEKPEEAAATPDKTPGDQAPNPAENTGDVPQEEESEEQPEEQKSLLQEEEEEISEAEDEEEGDKPLLGDLATLFEEDDTSLAVVESLSQGLKDIEVEHLVDITSDMSRMLHDANSSVGEGVDRELENPLGYSL